METRKQTRGERNCNPLNIKKTSIKWHGKVEGNDPIFESFKDFLSVSSFSCVSRALEESDETLYVSNAYCAASTDLFAASKTDS